MAGDIGARFPNVRAIDWMRLVLTSPDWRPENLARLRDLVDQRTAALGNRQQGSEESWVNDPADAYRRQDSLALLATGLFAVCAALLWRGDAGTADARLALGIAIAGLTALAAVGWLGWSLVQTHHVGVAPTIIETPREEVAIAPDVLRTPAGPSQLHAYRH